MFVVRGSTDFLVMNLLGSVARLVQRKSTKIERWCCARQASFVDCELGSLLRL